MINILIVEDEESIANLIRLALSQRGYTSTIASDGEEGANLVESRSFDLALLDVMLPKIGGFELFEYIKNFNIPVIFITAKSDIADRVKGLNLGAEDYIVKPFDIAELLARVDGVLRRHKKCEETMCFDDIKIDATSRIVTKGNKKVELTNKEYETLIFLLRNKNIALYRETIYEQVWNEPYMGDTRTVDLHIHRLRQKLSLKDKIESVYKVGYRFVG
ncbi:MAG: response regulator transcription factor [Ruminococcus sp.]